MLVSTQAVLKRCSERLECAMAQPSEGDAMQEMVQPWLPTEPRARLSPSLPGSPPGVGAHGEAGAAEPPPLAALGDCTYFLSAQHYFAYTARVSAWAWPALVARCNPGALRAAASRMGDSAQR